MMDIPKNKVLSVAKAGSKTISVRRKYVTDLNQVCHLDSNYEYDYALYLDYLFNKGEITGFIRNVTPFFFSIPVAITPDGTKTTKSCIPDFIVFHNDGTYEIHETKGWLNERAKNILKQFKLDFPNLTYKLITKDEILSLQQQFKDTIWGWEVVR